MGHHAIQDLVQRGYPDWLPDAARHYLAHVGGGRPIRALAREAQVHASTILRQVRRLEALREDPLVDEALRALATGASPVATLREEMRVTMPTMTMKPKALDLAAPSDSPPVAIDPRLEGEALRILRRLAEPHTLLVVGRDMDRAVVLREGLDGEPQRLAVVAREVAGALALQDWISSAEPAARILRYTITTAGRAELRRVMAAAFDSGPTTMPDDLAEDPRRLRHMRSSLADSPVTALARRKDANGQPFLPRALVVAAERLREDYELSHGALAAGMVRLPLTDGARAAQERLDAALAALGAGLSDVALRCCCYLEGMESIESRMEWSARSGKIVLRIALQRLEMHYAETAAPRVGETRGTSATGPQLRGQ